MHPVCAIVQVALYSVGADGHPPIQRIIFLAVREANRSKIPAKVPIYGVASSHYRVGGDHESPDDLLIDPGEEIGCTHPLVFAGGAMVTHFGKTDILLNDADIAPENLAGDAREEDFEKS